DLPWIKAADQTVRAGGGIDQAPRLQHDFLVKFENADPAKLHRAFLCSSYRGKFWALTARSTDILADEDIPEIKPPEQSRYGQPREFTHWPADNNDVPEAAQHALKNAATINKICQLIENKVEQGHGVVVIAGATGSRKTTFAREIARRYLSKRVLSPDAPADHPHVVTYEDPIESWFATSPTRANASGFDYTPRQKGLDVTDLDEAVTDALRQKPA